MATDPFLVTIPPAEDEVLRRINARFDRLDAALAKTLRAALEFHALAHEALLQITLNDRRVEERLDRLERAVFGDQR